MKKVSKKLAALLAGCLMLTGCSAGTQIDDYATNLTTDSSGQNTQGQLQIQSETQTSSKGISKDDIKVGVIHLSDPSEGSGYTYTHDLGIQGMQQNLGLSDEQIVRKINVAD